MKKQTLLRKILYLLVYACIFCVPLSGIAQNCTVNAGNASTSCAGDIINLSGSQGGPVTNPNTILWSVRSQPVGGTAVITNANSLLTTVTGVTVPGSYVFRFSATCSDNSTPFMDVTVTVSPQPTTPSISSTTNITCWTGTPITLTGNAPAAGETVHWSSSAGQATIANANSASTTFIPIFLTDDCYGGAGKPFTLTYTISNASGCSRSTTAIYNVQNTYALSASATPAPLCGTSTLLKGNCPGAGTALWTQVSGPNTATLATATARSTSATGFISGTYVFHYAVTGGCNAGAPPDVTVKVQTLTPVTVADAGNGATQKNQYFCTMPTFASLTGNAPAVGETLTWTQLSGGSSTITNPNARNTTVTGLTTAGGPYNYQYSIQSAAGCYTSDTVRLGVIPADVSISLTNLNNCYSYVTSGNILGGYVAFGDYLLDALDTVVMNITYLSGPEPSLRLTRLFVGNSYVGGLTNFGNYTYPSILLGNSLTHKFFGSDLYAIRDANATSMKFTPVLSYIAGSYKIRISFTTKCGTQQRDVIFTNGTVTGNSNAGTNALIACNQTTATLSGNYADGVGVWRTIKMPAGAIDPINSTNQTKKNPVLINLIPGTYTLRYSSDYGSCTYYSYSYSEASIVVSNTPPPTPSAGANRTTCSGTVHLSGTAVPFPSTALWTIISPTGTGAVIVGATTANPTVNGLLANTAYTFRYTLTNGCGTSSAQVVITTTTSVNSPSGFGSSIDCGIVNNPIPSNQTLTVYYASFTAGGSTDSNFTYILGPGVTFLSSTTYSTAKLFNFHFAQAAEVSIIYKLTNKNCPLDFSTDTATTIIYGDSPTFSAGPDQLLCAQQSYPATVSLSGTNVGLPIQWTQYSSTSGVSTINSPNSSNTTVSIPSDGTYQFEYSLPFSSAHCPVPSLHSIVAVTTSLAGSLARAGAAIQFCNGTGTTNLAATPLTIGTGNWTVYKILSGIAPVITTPTSATTAINFTQSGAVQLQWSSYGTNPVCGLSSSDIVNVTYIAPANAGINQKLCQNTSTNLNALSTASPATGSWSQIAGTSATITNTSDPKTTVTGLSNGTSIFRWSITAPGSCSSYSDDTIMVSNIIPVCVAGTNYVTYTAGTNKIALGATPANSGFTGSWSVYLKPAGSAAAVFSDATLPNAVYTSANITGDYFFVWTVTNGICTSTDFVKVTVLSAIKSNINQTLVNSAVTGSLVTNAYVPVNSVFSILTNAQHGSFTLNAVGTYTYTPTTGYIGKDTVSYQVCEPAPNSTKCYTSVLTVVVSPTLVNTIIVQDDNATTPINTAVQMCIKCNDSNPYGNTLGAPSIVTQPTNGAVVVNADGTVTYTPTNGYTGKDMYTYSVCDNNSLQACGTATAYITVTPAATTNTTYANDDAGSTKMNTALNGQVLGNDTDPESNTVTVAKLTSPANGAVVLNADGTYTYTPTTGYTGPDKFTYTKCDNGIPQACDVATVYLTVFPPTLCLQLRVYLEGALTNNASATAPDGRPLMRDDLRASPFTSANYLPSTDPYSTATTYSNFTAAYTKITPGTLAQYKTIPSPTSVFAVTGQNAIVDWVFVELRSKTNSATVLATRAALVQRDGDVVDLDGVSCLSFAGIVSDNYFVAIRHRNHLGAMTKLAQTPAQLGGLIDFTVPATPLFDFGTTKSAGVDYTGLAEHNSVVGTYRALWLGDVDANRKVKLVAPNDDPSSLLFSVVRYPANSSALANFAGGYGYLQGDVDMNSKAKFLAPSDDQSFIQFQVLRYSRNTTSGSNYNYLIEQLP